MNVSLSARVSTHDQEPVVQLGALRAHAAQRGWQVAEEFVDRGSSGAKERRPALERLMEAAWAGQCQIVLVWRFDRFARSVKRLVTALDTCRALGVAFVSLQEQLDTATPIGQAMFTIIGAIAQLERDIIRERVKAGSRARRGHDRLIELGSGGWRKPMKSRSLIAAAVGFIVVAAVVVVNISDERGIGAGDGDRRRHERAPPSSPPTPPDEEDSRESAS